MKMIGGLEKKCKCCEAKHEVDKICARTGVNLSLASTECCVFVTTTKTHISMTQYKKNYNNSEGLTNFVSSIGFFLNFPVTIIN